MFPDSGNKLYLCGMVVIEVETGQSLKVVIEPVEKSDFKNLTKTNYFFDWKLERSHEIYKLRLEGEILGLVSFERIPNEWRIHIRLLTVSVENKGRDKKYEHIIGNLLTFVSKLAIKDYAELSCVSLVPKSKIAQHYIEKYNMRITGMTLSLEITEILSLLTNYDHD